ncbi:MAG: asparagine synthase (glutamine-hydrolyzing) [Alphaproteobacteria bacterium]|nr:asparagine synthase (glutamine-hydrolyzing) [Alphaproteobacteria bacterium]
MCGIVGFTRPDLRGEDIIRAMMAAIRHRGPDDQDIRVDEQFACGHLRLTIIDPVGGRQPRHDPDTGDMLVFNGEIYDYTSHAARLAEQGVPLRDKSDTEVLFQMIRRNGVEQTLRSLDGMFAFAYRDGATGQVTLARDKFGEKPLFYAHIRGQLIFASEIKALRRHPVCSALGFDFDAIGQYLTFDYVPAPRTGFQAIRKLLPGHLLQFDGQETDLKPYWDMPFQDGDHHKTVRKRGEEAAIDDLDARLRRSIESRLVADVPVGIFLSGGIDSALIAALARDYAPGIAAYTIKLPGDGYDETPYAARVAGQFGLTHHVREVSGTDVLDALDKIEALQDEPFSDPSIVPTYLLCETARQGVKVALGGDGGDELFAGYINFQANRHARLMAHIPGGLAAALRRLTGILPASDRYMGLSFKLAQLSQGFGRPERHQPFLWMAPFDQTARARLLTGDLEAREQFEPIDQWIAQQGPMDPLDELQFLFSRIYLPDGILTKVDRASMYNSLEVRAPFLAPAVAECALGLPPEWRLNGSKTKYLLRKLALRYLPPDIVTRRKHGFGLPVASMLRGALRERVHDVLLDATNPLAGCFVRREVEALLAQHMAGSADHRKRLWSLYCLYRFAAGARENQTALAA